MKAIQLLQSYATIPEARNALGMEKDTPGYLGGLVLLPDSQHNLPRLQAFFEWDEDPNPYPCPEGMSLVDLPKSMLPAFCIRQEKA